MERNIKFRGQDYQRHWHYGSFVMFNNGSYAIAENDPTWTDDGYHNDDFNLIKVRPDTVGQFSELTDNDNKEIYEGDIVEWQQYSFTGQKTDTIKGVVYFDTDCGAYGLRTELIEDFSWLRIFYNGVDLGDIKVIGNIHDNPELLKKETAKEADHWEEKVNQLTNQEE